MCCGECSLLVVTKSRDANIYILHIRRLFLVEVLSSSPSVALLVTLVSDALDLGSLSHATTSLDLDIFLLDVTLRIIAHFDSVLALVLFLLGLDTAELFFTSANSHVARCSGLGS